MGRRKVGLSVAVIAVVLGLVGYGVYCVLNEPGWLLVIAPPNETLHVEVEGQAAATIAPGTVHKWVLDHGDYEVTVKDASGHKLNRARVKITTDRIILPASANQCFVYFDITHYQYGVTGGDPSSIHMVTRYRQNGQSFKWLSGYFTEGELPSAVQGDQQVRMLREVWCDMLDRPDQEIFAALGYGRR